MMSRLIVSEVSLSQVHVLVTGWDASKRGAYSDGSPDLHAVLPILIAHVLELAGCHSFERTWVAVSHAE